MKVFPLTKISSLGIYRGCRLHGKGICVPHGPTEDTIILVGWKSLEKIVHLN